MAIECVSRIFVGKRKDSNLTLAAGYTVHYGTIVAKRDDTGENKLQVIDDVLVTIFRAPHSYTGEDSVEISCHGSSYVIQKILSLLISEGCSMAEPGEYTKRAFLNGKLDLTQAEAVADLIAALGGELLHVASDLGVIALGELEEHPLQVGGDQNVHGW